MPKVKQAYEVCERWADGSRGPGVAEVSALDKQEAEQKARQLLKGLGYKGWFFLRRIPKEERSRPIPQLPAWTAKHKQGGIPMWIIMHPWLSNAAKVVLQILDGHAWKKDRLKSWPAQETIAKAMRSGKALGGHVSVRAVYDSLKELIDAGVIGKDTRRVSRNRLRHQAIGANEYHLLYKRPDFNPSHTNLPVHFFNTNRKYSAGLST